MFEANCVKCNKDLTVDDGYVAMGIGTLCKDCYLDQQFKTGILPQFPISGKIILDDLTAKQ
jgi:hypothetical protein